MKIRNSLVAGILAVGCLSGVTIASAGAASAAPAELSSALSTAVPTAVKPVCQPAGFYVATRDRNGRWYCKFAPVPGHNRRHKTLVGLNH